MKITQNSKKETIMSDRIIHVAGPALALHFEPKQEIVRLIQRCAVCGDLLLQRKIRAKSKKRLTFWNEGQLVEIREGEQISILSRDDNCLPENTCGRLVEDNVPDPPELIEEDLEEMEDDDDEEDTE